MPTIKCNVDTVFHILMEHGDAGPYLKDNYQAELKLNKDTNEWHIVFETEHHYSLFRIKYSEYL